MHIVDSRRLTGPSLLLDRPGVILDVALTGLDPDAALAAWTSEVTRLLDAVGWGGTKLATRVHPGGASLAFVAPIDALYAATEVNEAAWRLTVVSLGGDVSFATERGHGHDDTLEDLGADGDDGAEPFEATVERLLGAIFGERSPALMALATAAASHDIVLLSDDGRVSLGLGSRSRSWPVEQLPAVAAVPWAELGSIPVALITGTNGKSTSVRLIGAIARAAGKIAGVTSTDCVTVGDEVVEEGDFSGPNGARGVLRDRRVELAILELARGGLLRRGLAVPRADVALVTNVSNDHLGEYGVYDLATLADAKLIVAKAVGPNGRVVLNADDALLLERGARLKAPVVWFTLDAAHPGVVAHVASGGEACVLDGEALVFRRAGERVPLARIHELPIAFGGSARYNIANALGAAAVAASLGLPIEAIRTGLRTFGLDPMENPGRANRWELGGVTAIVDYAHNPHGMAALAQVVAAIPAERRGIVIGQAGDRDDESIREYVRAAWVLQPAHVFIKDMHSFLRGRKIGAVPAVIASELSRLGATAAEMSRHDDELDAIRTALAWARPGDVLVLTTHAEREAVTALMRELVAGKWRPGDNLPAIEPPAAPDSGAQTPQA